MARDDDQANYTVKAAAKRFHRSERTIRRWVGEGMATRKVSGMIVIDHDVLQAELRQRSLANPTIPTTDPHAW